ncbi:MAG: molybdenum cofactor carrier protein [Roseibacillus sp.]|jgi:uncharacterized protein (TIGR00725 family)|nr:molybdenum cofactor carrier protein [Roseibacillus sp.]MBI24775.1 molybdenum cofactor carrier protein [Roseibacillus sp.]MCP4730962.1 molybdenum cofactor carrier protein [Roseibacillus sp.]MDP7308505.1 hypothetical protein [Roseibacillus sp.]MDP7655174.1 hypothetical protein [Roseibacillus sp.]|tara:strand:+ start:1455 stop:1964 length:510 start_codon:yes stop_codon:yes gene_type:complete
MKRLKIVGVMGSGQRGHEDLSLSLGEMLARLGVHLLTGGGSGVMRSVSKGFRSVAQRQGLTLGILPGLTGNGAPESPPGYPNDHVELVIRTHLPGRGAEGGTERSRNAINIATADAVVVLPGGAGTASEAGLAQRFRKPVIGLGGGGEAQGVAQAESLEQIEQFLRAVL